MDYTRIEANHNRIILCLETNGKVVPVGIAIRIVKNA